MVADDADEDEDESEQKGDSMRLHCVLTEISHGEGVEVQTGVTFPASSLDRSNVPCLRRLGEPSVAADDHDDLDEEG